MQRDYSTQPTILIVGRYAKATQVIETVIFHTARDFSRGQECKSNSEYLYPV